MSLVRLYYFVFQYCPAVPLIYGFMHRKQLDAPLRLFLAYLALSLGLTIIMTFLALGGHNTLWLTNISLPLYAGVILWTLSLWLRNNTAKSLFRLMIVPFILLWAWELSSMENLLVFTTYSGPILDIILVSASLYVIFEANAFTDQLITDMPRFWISSGVLFTFGGLFIITLLGPSLLNVPREAFVTVLMVQPVLNIIVHLFYLLGYIRQCRKQI